MRLKTLIIIISGLLLIPFIAMQFTNEVNWGMMDFAVMATILFVFGNLARWSWNWASQRSYKLILVSASIVLFLLTWAELGVGIFGTPFAGN